MGIKEQGGGQRWVLLQPVLQGREEVQKQGGRAIQNCTGMVGRKQQFSIADMMAAKYSCWRVRTYTLFLLCTLYCTLSSYSRNKTVSKQKKSLVCFSCSILPKENKVPILCC